MAPAVRVIAATLPINTLNTEPDTPDILGYIHKVITMPNPSKTNDSALRRVVTSV
jgi:hypothetical protein